MQVKINNEFKEFKKGITLEEISKYYSGNFVCASVNNRIRELSYKLEFDATVEFLSIDNSMAMNIYKATLRYVVAMAFKNVFKDENIRFSNSISMSIFAKIIGRNMDRNDLNILEEEVKRIIAMDLKIERKIYTISEMKDYYTKMGYLDKVANLNYRNDNCHVYETGGYRNYMYSYMLPSTGYLKDYKFILYYPGFMIQFPRVESRGNLPEFKDEPIFLKTLAQANKWASLTESENISDINKKTESKEELIKFINLCEMKQYHDIEKIGKKIEEHIEDIRLICIAGPSSSGKTTFSKKLEIELLTRDIKPVRISLDNYYKPIEETPLDENGNYDFEHIDALNIKLFNENMSDLIEGKETMLPILDFKTHTVTFTNPIKLDKSSVIMIEGIHALNDLLTVSIPKQNKFKIYICPLSQRNIDNHNPISFTDLRLIRRTVRDKEFRNYSAKNTLNSWASVRSGERKWIYPMMEDADFIFNSELGYELLALKDIGLQAYQDIDVNDSEYIRANSLTKFMKIFNSIDTSLIPNNSLIREFIGGSVFESID